MLSREFVPRMTDESKVVGKLPFTKVGENHVNDLLWKGLQIRGGEVAAYPEYFHLERKIRVKLLAFFQANSAGSWSFLALI
jgi:hypothetical protein